jgi:hypothetical protein
MFPVPGEVSTPVLVAGALGSESTYTFVCRFWLVVFEMNYLYYFQKAVSVSIAVTIFHKLLAWANGLNASVRRNEHNQDYVLNLQ